jgi:hypothetical protein
LRVSYLLLVSYLNAACNQYQLVVCLAKAIQMSICCGPLGVNHSQYHVV